MGVVTAEQAKPEGGVWLPHSATVSGCHCNGDAFLPVPPPHPKNLKPPRHYSESLSLCIS